MNKKELKINKKDFEVFLEITRKINKKFGLTPILWGSLGLSLIIGEFKKVDDVDVLIPDEFLGNKWKELVQFIKNHGFVLKDEREHEFEKNNVKIGFSNYSGLEELGVKINSLEKQNVKEAKFLTLSAEQYLKIYKKFIKDDFRIKTGKVRGDLEKINLIENFIKIHKIF